MRRFLLSTAIAALMGAAALPAQAQVDTRALYDRIDRLERDISVLQQQLARGAGSAAIGGTTVVRSPAVGGSGEAVLSGSAADRIEQLEEQIRQLTGKVEEANFKAAQVSKQLERMQTDIDLRFKEIQPGAQTGQAPQMQMPAPQTSSNGAPQLIPPKGVNLGGNSADGAGPAPGPQTLGTMPRKELEKATAQPQAQPQPQPAAAPLPKEPQALYDEASKLLERGDYAGAERGFQAFVQQHPSHALAGNAHYWLGDIAYARKDFSNAAYLFAEAYKKYPKHGKAPDMLYKLGASFGQLGKTKEACKAYSLLFAEHPNMPDRIKRAANADKQKYSCN
ncbi:MAG: tol-pal system protein YbgF [Actinomycetota bacterium]